MKYNLLLFNKIHTLMLMKQNENHIPYYEDYDSISENTSVH